MENIDNVNDRTNLVLLKLKRDKTRKDHSLLKKLTFLYPDNETFETKIIKNLRSRGLISTTNTEGRYLNGVWTYNNPDLPKEDYTTKKGIKSLDAHLFPSEFRKELFDKRFKKWQIIGISIAAIGGLLTILSFIYKFFYIMSN